VARVAVLTSRDEGLAGDGDGAAGLDAAAVLGVREAADAVLSSLRRAGHEALPVTVTRDVRAAMDDLARARADVVFFLVESVDGDARLEAAVAAALEWAGIPFTGSGARALALAQEKPLARAVLSAAGVPVPRGCVLARGDEPLSDLGPAPWIVKPSREDASHGLDAGSVVTDEPALRERARWLIRRYGQPALVESFVSGREFNVSLLGEGESLDVLPVSEIDFSSFPAGRPAFVTYAAKWEPESAEYLGTPPVFSDLPAATHERLATVARRAYAALGLRDYGRVDVRWDEARGPLVLDVNPNPDISPGAGLARAAERAGLDHVALVDRIVKGALRGRTPAAARTR
jgi:D-alanine-D-alanine ligase